jgi:hypothetical protein
MSGLAEAVYECRYSVPFIYVFCVALSNHIPWSNERNITAACDVPFSSDAIVDRCSLVQFKRT